AIICYLLFFFRAEDGIRDFHVTGVQTCALPISERAAVEVGVRFLGRGFFHAPFDAHLALERLPEEQQGGARVGLQFQALARLVRSEERRVGKGCGGAWRSQGQCSKDSNTTSSSR